MSVRTHKQSVRLSDEELVMLKWLKMNCGFHMGNEIRRMIRQEYEKRHLECKFPEGVEDLYQAMMADYKTFEERNKEEV